MNDDNKNNNNPTNNNTNTNTNTSTNTNNNNDNDNNNNNKNNNNNNNKIDINTNNTYSSRKHKNMNNDNNNNNSNNHNHINSSNCNNMLKVYYLLTPPCRMTLPPTRMALGGIVAGMARLGAEVPARDTTGGPQGHRNVPWTRRGCSSFGSSSRCVKMQCPMRIQLRFPQAKRMMQTRARETPLLRRHQGIRAPECAYGPAGGVRGLPTDPLYPIRARPSRCLSFLLLLVQAETAELLQGLGSKGILLLLCVLLQSWSQFPSPQMNAIEI